MDVQSRSQVTLVWERVTLYGRSKPLTRLVVAALLLHCWPLAVLAATLGGAAGATAHAHVVPAVAASGAQTPFAPRRPRSVFFQIDSERKRNN